MRNTRKKRIKEDFSDDFELEDDDVYDKPSAPLKKAKVSQARRRNKKDIEEASDGAEISEEKKPVAKKKKVVNEPPKSVEEGFSQIMETQTALPGGLPAVVWRHILSFLSPYEQNLSRFWSKPFRNISADLASTTLRKIAITLGYDIPPQFLSLSAFYFRAKKTKKGLAPIPISLEQKKELFQLIKKLGLAFHRGELFNYKKNLESICKRVEIRLFPERVALLHPFLLSVLIDYFYFILATENKNSTFFSARMVDLLSGIKGYVEVIASRPDVTRMQKSRLKLLQAIIWFEEQKQEEITSYHYLDELFGIKLDENTTEILKKNIYSPHFYLNSDVSLLICSNPAWVSYKQCRANEQRLVLEEQKRESDQNASFLNQYPAFQKYFTSRRVNGDFFIPKGMRLLLEEYLEIRKYQYEEVSSHHRKVLDKLLAREDLYSHPPFWLRSYLFVPDDLEPEHLAYLQTWDLTRLPSFIFKKDYTFGELVKLKPYFSLFEQGVLPEHFNSTGWDNGLEALANMGHDIRGVHCLAALDEPVHPGLLGEILLNIKPVELDLFLSSWVRDEIQKQGIDNLEFVKWAMNNFSFLESMDAQNREFFKHTLTALFSTRRVEVLKKERGSLEGRTFIRISYFDLIRVSFSAVGAALSKTLFECLFTPGQSILPKIMGQNPVYIFASLLAQYRGADLTEIFINFFNNTGGIFSEFDISCEHKHLFLACLTLDTLSTLVRKNYKDLSFLRWLSKPTHREVLVRLLAFVPTIECSSRRRNLFFASNGISWHLWNSPIAWRLKSQHKHFLQTINHLVRLKILDDPSLSCLWLQEHNFQQFNKKNFKENGLWRNAVYKALPEAEPKDLSFLQLKDGKEYKGKPYSYYLEKVEYEELFSFLLIHDVSATEYLLDALAENDLMDKPEYASLILEKFGVVRCLELGSRLKYFAHVKDRASLAILLREIKKAYIEEGLSLQACVARHCKVADLPPEKLPEISVQVPRQFDPRFFQMPLERPDADKVICNLISNTSMQTKNL